MISLGRGGGNGGRYFGGRSRTLAWPSPEGIGTRVPVRRHEDPAEMIVASPSRSPRHMIGPADRAQSGQGIPGIPTPMLTGTMSNRKRRSTTTSTIATRLISSTVPRGRSSQDRTSVPTTRGLRNPTKAEMPYPRGQFGQQGSYGLLSGATMRPLHRGRWVGSVGVRILPRFIDPSSRAGG